MPIAPKKKPTQPFVPDFKMKTKATGKIGAGPAARPATTASTAPAKSSGKAPARPPVKPMSIAAFGKPKAPAVAPKPKVAIPPRPRVKPMTSWSFSRYSDYKTCPLKCRLKHIEKIKEPGSVHLERGIAVHNEAEAYVKGTLAKLPDSLKSFKDEFNKMRKMYKEKKLPMIVEDNWAFDIEWNETEWNNWAECWVRIKLDSAHYEEGEVLYVTDYKTGKMSAYKNAEYMEQLELYALAALLMTGAENPTIKPRLLYVDSGDQYPPLGQEVTYTKADLKRLKGEWTKRVKPMMSDTNFPPRPNGTCGFCWYGQAKVAEGGPGLCAY